MPCNKTIPFLWNHCPKPSILSIGLLLKLKYIWEQMFLFTISIFLFMVNHCGFIHHPIHHCNTQADSGMQYHPKAEQGYPRVSPVPTISSLQHNSVLRADTSPQTELRYPHESCAHDFIPAQYSELSNCYTILVECYALLASGTQRQYSVFELCGDTCIFGVDVGVFDQTNQQTELIEHVHKRLARSRLSITSNPELRYPHVRPMHSISSQQHDFACMH